MANDDLKRTPHHPQKRQDVWWYEESDGIHIVMEDRRIRYPEDRFVPSNSMKITWASLRAALRRKDKK